MCGRYNVTDSPEIRVLMERLQLPGTVPTPQLNVPPGGSGEFVMEAAGDRHLLTGIWSLLIEPRPTGNGYRPNPKFQTFNARSDRLISSPLWKKRIRPNAAFCRLVPSMNGKANRSTTFIRRMRRRR